MESRMLEYCLSWRREFSALMILVGHEVLRVDWKLNFTERAKKIKRGIQTAELIKWPLNP